MSNNPLISVVMSVYNSDKYLVEAIESILNQTYSNFEFIIINDGSTDNSLNIIKNYMKKDDRIILIDRENKGLPYSLNEGIEKAKGEYIARMDADDISVLNRFAEQVAFMGKNKDIGICGTWVKIFGENRKNYIWKLPINNNELKVRLLFFVPFPHPTVMIRKKILEKNKLKYNLKYINAQDYELWSRISKHTKIANIPKVLLHYRYVNTSITRQSDNYENNKRYELLKGVFNKILNELEIDNTEKENRLHFILSGGNERIARNKISLDFLEQYLNIIITHNKKKKIFNEQYLISLLGKRFFIVSYYQAKQGNYQILKAFKSALFYIGIKQILKEKLLGYK